MSRKRYRPEQIIGVLREAEAALGQGEQVGAGLVKLTPIELKI